MKLFIKLIKLITATVVICSALSAQADVWRKDLPQAKLVGSGEFTWWGLSIYSARLWQESGISPITFNPQQSFALEITYHKSISRERFVDTSIDEIKRLHGDSFNAEQMQQWRSYMAKAFTDVKIGDQLIGVHIPQFGCRFYSQSKLLAEIPDEKFSKAFFSIWLDPRSKDNQLRTKLTGQSNGSK
ncbi:chalcone isomerase family protein [Undibacterium sp. Di24W]|uniref:chalcone isomerase family protein n=1 Tax=Undibacterium sp. Di24W TaxID=3413033 RepID=UPI003BF24B01